MMPRVLVSEGRVVEFLCIRAHIRRYRVSRVLVPEGVKDLAE